MRFTLAIIIFLFVGTTPLPSFGANATPSEFVRKTQMTPSEFLPGFHAFNCWVEQTDDSGKPVVHGQVWTGFREWAGGGPVGSQWNVPNYPMSCQASFIAPHACSGKVKAEFSYGKKHLLQTLPLQEGTPLQIHFLVKDWQRQLKPYKKNVLLLDLLTLDMKVTALCEGWAVPFTFHEGFTVGFSSGE